MQANSVRLSTVRGNFIEYFARFWVTLLNCVQLEPSVCFDHTNNSFMLYALNFDNMYLWRTCKRLGPVRVRRSKYSLLLLLLLLLKTMKKETRSEITYLFSWLDCCVLVQCTGECWHDISDVADVKERVCLWRLHPSHNSRHGGCGWFLLPVGPVSVCACMSVCMHGCQCACMDACQCACMDVSVHAWMSVCMHAWMSVCMHACQCACMDVSVHAWMSVCMHAWMSVCRHACQCACMHVNVHAWMSVCMHGSMYMHVCQCAYMHFSVHASM